MLILNILVVLELFQFAHTHIMLLIQWYLDQNLCTPYFRYIWRFINVALSNVASILFKYSFTGKFQQNYFTALITGNFATQQLVNTCTCAVFPLASDAVSYCCQCRRVQHASSFDWFRHLSQHYIITASSISVCFTANITFILTHVQTFMDRIKVFCSLTT